nr:immunoglobulin light chain junction region [Macaca mulatta]MOX82407.1 immunoglobulin light chain junction region [Macaca mulatta]MOX82481.1 immunoglobulin light chain junction region [Macaca mulatta]
DYYCYSTDSSTNGLF